MKRSRTPQVLLILAAVALAGGAGGSFMQYTELSDKFEALRELKKNARDPKEIQTELDETTAKVQESKTEIMHLEKSIPAFAYVPTMLKELETFGKQNGIEVLGVRPIPKPDTKDKNKPNKQPYEEIAIEVKGRGQFASVQKFISALQKFPKIVGARAVSMQPKNDPGTAGPRNLDVTIELRAYLFPPAEGEKIDLSVAGSHVPPTNSEGKLDPAKAAAQAPAKPAEAAKPNGTPFATGGSNR